MAARAAAAAALEAAGIYYSFGAAYNQHGWFCNSLVA
jgi:hypothetical protein